MMATAMVETDTTMTTSKDTMIKDTMVAKATTMRRA